MIRDEENKVKNRDTYIVTKIEKNHASCVKTSSKSREISYTDKLENLFNVARNNETKKENTADSDKEEDASSEVNETEEEQVAI